MNFDFVFALKAAPAALIGLTVHEFCHALAATKLGDSTAKDQGRLTLNPIKHIDPLGFLLIVVAGFGWAKPVQFTPANLKSKHRDEIIIALAGPISNLLLAILFFGIARIFYLFDFFNATDNGLFVVNLLILWGVINLGLFLFNLIPIPPLDGSHLYTTFIASINPTLTQNLYKYGTWLLLAIILFQNFTKYEIIPLSPIISFMTKTSLSILNFQQD